MRKHLAFLACACAIGLGAPTFAQSNTISGTDVQCALLDVGDDLEIHGRIGTFPNGTSGLSMSTTSCNSGSVNVPWFQAMQENHPMIAFMAVREDADRMVQISNRSWVKHAFFALSNNQCGFGCPNGSNGTSLNIGCSDTYSTGNNGSRFWLGPPEEINPWLGTWTAFGSFFDCPTGGGCDGARSYQGGEPNEVNHRIEIPDSEMLDTNATYYYCGYYVIRGEPEANREDNMNSRTFVPTWNGSNFTESTTGVNPNTFGSVLNRWSGATVDSNTNAGNDGRVYVAVKTTMVDELFHYEYALHNRDNDRGISAFRIPVTPGAQVSGFGFHDFDQNAANDWTATVQGGEIVFETNSNPLPWNSIFNFWFDATAEPAPVNTTLDQFVTGGGISPDFDVPSTGPAGALVGSFCFGNGGNPGCTPCPCGNDAFGQAGGCLNGTFTSCVLEKSGAASISNDSLNMNITGCNPSTFALLASADNRLPNMGICPPGSGIQSVVLNGLRCVGGNLLRHGTRATDTSGMNTNPWGPPGGPPGGIAGQGGFAAGQERHFQVFYREMAGAVCGLDQNTSNGVSVEFEP